MKSRPCLIQTLSVMSVAAFVQVGCALDRPEAPRFTTADSSGVVIGRSTSPSWPEGRGWRLSPEPVLDIGEQSGEPEYLFSGIAGATRRDDGSLLVCNSTDRTLRYYDAAGTFTHQSAGPGDGPNELLNMIRCFQRGGETWVYQAPAMPMKIFDGAGNVVRAMPIPRPGGRFAVLMDVYEDGSLLLRQEPPRRELPLGLSVLEATLVRTVAGAADLDTLGTFNSGRWVRGDQTAFPGAFTPTLAAVAHGDLSVVSWPERMDMAFVGARGVVSVRIQRAREVRPVTTAHRSAFVDRILNGPMPTGDTPYNRPVIRRAIVDMMEYPDVLPAHYRVIVASSGALWVERGDAPRDPLPYVAEAYAASTVWDVFTSEGEWLGPVQLHAGFEPWEIGEDYVLGVHHDGVGVERLRLYSLDKPEG